jgi:hypothetical protein
VNQSKKDPKKPTSPGEQIFVSLIVILFGTVLCFIPLVFSLNVTANIGGNRGPGGAAALIVGDLFLIYGLIGLCLGVVKVLRRQASRPGTRH